MKKILYPVIILITAFILLAGLLMGSVTSFEQKVQYLYVYNDGQPARVQILAQMRAKDMIKRVGVFALIADQAGIWDNITPGRFEITHGQNLIDILRILKRNKQSEVRWVINKFRTRDDLAKSIGKNFSTDSATAIAFLSNNDSLRRYDVDTNTVMTLIIPDTYFYKWNMSLPAILSRLQNEQKNFWKKKSRLEKAAALKLTPKQAYAIASIVEEETNYLPEKGNIASVYINRARIGMPLGADPTIKFALKQFGLKRILFEHLRVASPFNTYLNRGLPPGPICTPSVETLDATLNAPQTKYLYFVSNSSDFRTHHFSATYAEHLQYANEYRKVLNERKIK